MNLTTNLTAMADYSTHPGGQILFSTLLVLMMSLVMPVVAIAVVIAKSSAAEKRNSPVGLGVVSLHDELSDFIAAVERGDITMQSLDGEGAHGRAGVSPQRTVSSPAT